LGHASYESVPLIDIFLKLVAIYVDKHDELFFVMSALKAKSEANWWI
jgi:hypothetical protein